MRPRDEFNQRFRAGPSLEPPKNVWHTYAPRVSEKEDEAKKTVYNPRDPIARVFSVIDDLVELAVFAATPISIAQQFNIRYVVLHKTGNFSQPIVEWNWKPVVDKTWANFRTHFHTAHNELHANTVITAQDAGMHHNNMVRDVVAALQETMSSPTEP